MEREKTTVTDVRAESVFRDGATPVPGYRVEFVTKHGIRSYVHVPRSDTLVADVEEAVKREAEKLDTIGKTIEKR